MSCGLHSAPPSLESKCCLRRSSQQPTHVNMAGGKVINLARFLGPVGEARGAFSAALQYSTSGGSATYSLPPLPYDYSALEPYISGEIMQLHHAKHHQTYVTNLNKALEQYAEADNNKDLQKMITLQSAINFNGGGAWQGLSTYSAYHVNGLTCDV